MRNNLPFLYASNNNPNNPTCLIDGVQATTSACHTSSHNILSNGSKYEFSWCTWTSCTASSDAGGALKCTGIGTKVYLESCTFLSCSSEREGGAIHTSSIHTLDAKHSFFHKCSTSTKENDEGSGAMWINGIKQILSVSDNSFISCTSKASGGAFIVKDCTENIQGEVIRNCRYIDCNATDTSPDGGAIWIWTNDKLLGLKNCLFSVCNSGQDGGAVKHTLYKYEEKSFPLRYCFFNKNKAPNGNDIFFNSLPADAPCLHCFSTSDSKRVSHYVGSDRSSLDPNWLPQA